MDYNKNNAVEQPIGDLPPLPEWLTPGGRVPSSAKMGKAMQDYARAAIAAYLASQSQAAQPSIKTWQERMNDGSFRAEARAAGEVTKIYIGERALREARDAEIAELRAALAGTSQATKAQAVPVAEVAANMTGIHWLTSDGYPPAVGTKLYVASVAKEAPAVLEGFALVSVEVTPSMRNLWSTMRESDVKYIWDRMLHAASIPVAVDATREAETGSVQAEREMAIAQAVRRACCECYSPDDLAADWSEKMGDLNLSSIIKSVAPTTSTVSAPTQAEVYLAAELEPATPVYKVDDVKAGTQAAPEEVRNQALEEAAKWHDKMQANTSGSRAAYVHHQSAAAIRALRTNTDQANADGGAA